MSRNSIVPHFFTLYSLLCFTVIAAADPDLRQTREQLASGPGGKQKMDYLLYLPNGYHESKKGLATHPLSARRGGTGHPHRQGRQTWSAEDRT